MKKLLLFLCASIFALTCGAAPKQGAGTNQSSLHTPTGACSFLDAQTIKDITGLNVTEIKDNGESCVYVDPKAPLNPMVASLGAMLGQAFGGASPLRLQGAPNVLPKPQTGAGLIVRQPSNPGDLTNVKAHDYAQAQLGQVPPQAGCGMLTDVSGLNAVSVVCLNGAVGEGGVVQDGKVVFITYLAPGATATDDIMGKLITTAAGRM